MKTDIVRCVVNDADTLCAESGIGNSWKLVYITIEDDHTVGMTPAAVKKFAKQLIKLADYVENRKEEDDDE